jgi:phospholipid transport system substrate-binding protein
MAPVSWPPVRLGISAALLFAALLGIPVTGPAQEHSPEQVVRTTADELLEQLRERRDALHSDPERLQRAVDAVLDPALDFDLTTRLVLGRHWRRATPGQRSRFSDEFRRMLLRTYSAPLLEYADDIAIDFLPSPAPKDGRGSVRTVLSYRGSPPVAVNYQLRRTGEVWRIYDVVIEGVSAVVTFRATFGDAIQRLGLDAFLDRLEAKNLDRVPSARTGADS